MRFFMVQQRKGSDGKRTRTRARTTALPAVDLTASASSASTGDDDTDTKDGNTSPDARRALHRSGGVDVETALADAEQLLAALQAKS
jgi:hypothetical protein